MKRVEHAGAASYPPSQGSWTVFICAAPPYAKHGSTGGPRGTSAFRSARESRPLRPFLAYAAIKDKQAVG